MSAATARQALLRALITRLASLVPATVKGVYSQPPQVDDPENDDAFPYLVIDSIELVDLGSDTTSGYDGLIRLSCQTRTEGELVAAEIQSAVYDLLHEQEALLIVDGFGVSSVMEEASAVTPLADGISREGLQSFRIYFEPVEG
jgi:hypothetical protein